MSLIISSWYFLTTENINYYSQGRKNTKLHCSGSIVIILEVGPGRHRDFIRRNEGGHISCNLIVSISIYVCTKIKPDVISYESLRERISLTTPMERKCSSKTNVAPSTIAKTVAIGLLALLSNVVALTPFLFSIGHVMAQSGNTGSQTRMLPPAAQHFPPAFPPGDSANFLRFQVVQRAGPSTNLGNGISTSTALCHADEQVVAGGFVERRSGSSSPGQSSAQSAIDFKVLASYSTPPPTNGWAVRAIGSNTSFAALAQCTKIIMQ
jgi:hypothetical protein